MKTEMISVVNDDILSLIFRYSLKSSSSSYLRQTLASNFSLPCVNGLHESARNLQVFYTFTDQQDKSFLVKKCFYLFDSLNHSSFAI